MDFGDVAAFSSWKFSTVEYEAATQQLKQLCCWIVACNYGKYKL